MEYNLLKTLEPNLGLQMCPIRNPHLTPYPAIDYVNPGLAQAARLFSFYVPLYTHQSPYNIAKEEDNSNLQEGGGSKDPDSNDVGASESIDADSIDPIQYNNRKRKIMGDAIQASFMHPKILTGQIDLEPKSKVKKKSDNDFKSGKGQIGKTMKHKFQFE
jgi:hypothetical protein